MDYNKLQHRLVELDKPVIAESGEMAVMPSQAQSTAPPSMSVNLNAQGMGNIEELLKLITKVNPDMAKPASAMTTDPQPASMLSLPIGMDGEEDGEEDGDKSEVAPLAAIGAGLGRAAAGSMGAGSIGQAAGGIAGNIAGSAAADMFSDDDEVESKENYANEPDEEYKDIDYITKKVSGGMNRPKDTFSKVAGGDNPMQKITHMEGDELRAAIRSELKQRLAEAKGAK